MNRLSVVSILILAFFYLSPTSIFADWPMAGATPERTSYTPDTLSGNLYVEWYKPIESYIPHKANLIITNNTIYIPTANGIYTMAADTGTPGWVFPTELPIGNSPTVKDGVVYAGGMDHKLYAINGLNGQLLWSFNEADAGYDTNPLVVNQRVYLGNRNGTFYAIYDNTHPQKGQLAWKYQTQGPIHFSAAYKDGVIYLASDDSSAYALNATNGNLIWKTHLPVGNGFHSWWPVIIGDYVIFSGSAGSRGRNSEPGNIDFQNQNYELRIPSVPDNTLIFPQLADGTLDISNMYQFYEDKPTRRDFFLINRLSGQEVTYDKDNDGKPEYAPLYKAGVTSSGNYYPPAVGPNGHLYIAYHYQNNRGQVVEWNVGDTFIKPLTTGSNAVDEPLAYTLGGNTIFWNLCCDREMGSLGSGQIARQFVSYNLPALAPGYDIMNSGYHPTMFGINKVFGQGLNGVYGAHGDQNPPIPYNGRLYTHRSNAIIAFSPTNSQRNLDLWPKNIVLPEPAPVDESALKAKLATEIQKMIAAGHLRPPYAVLGFFSFVGNNSQVGDKLSNYFKNPADTILVLSRALPHLSPELQTQLRDYLQNEYNFATKVEPNPLDTIPLKITDIGWATGAAREAFDVPPEPAASMANYPATAWGALVYEGWTFWRNNSSSYKFPPYNTYALWKYVLSYGDETQIQQKATEIFTLVKRNQILGDPPSDTILLNQPQAVNAWIAGYWGYLELAKLAGDPEDSSKRATLDRLLTFRTQNFAKDNIWGGPNVYNYRQTLAVAHNFIYLTPELGQYLHDHALTEVQGAINEYETVAPFWFATHYEAAFGEQAKQPEYDYQALFAAKAYVLKEPASQLIKYLDVPAFPVGDLFYIQNLVTILEAPTGGSVTTTPTPTPLPGDVNGDRVVNILDYTLLSNNFGTSDSAADLNVDGIVNILDYTILSNNFGMSG